MKNVKRMIASIGMLSTVAMAAPRANPVALVQGMTNRVVAGLKARQGNLKHNFGYIAKLIEKNVLPHVDRVRMAGMVVGRNAWMQATPSQRLAFVKEFQKQVVLTYANAFSNYNHDTVVVLPLRNGFQGRVTTVSSIITRASGQKIHIDYSLLYKKRQNTWKIYDFSIENLSMVQNYSSQYKSTLMQGGLVKLTAALTKEDAA